MWELLRALGSVVDGAEWYFNYQLKSFAGEEVQQSTAFIGKERATLREQFYTNKTGSYSQDYIKRTDTRIEEILKARYPNEYAQELNFLTNSEKVQQALGNLSRVEQANQLRRVLQPGPFKKFRSLRENVLDLENRFRQVFGNNYNNIMKILTGFTFNEFLGFLNVLKYFKNMLAYIDPKKMTGDLLRSLGQGVNQMFAELGEITGYDTIELSPTTEITTLSSSWLTNGWYIRMNSGGNIVSNGTLVLWDENGRTYTISNCPEYVWDQMKAARGKYGHWYAPLGAGSWLHYYIKMGVVSIW